MRTPITHWLDRQRAWAVLLAALPASIALAAVLSSLISTSPTTEIQSAVATRTPIPTVEPTEERIVQPTNVPSTPFPLPTDMPTATLMPYSMGLVEGLSELGISSLYLIDTPANQYLDPVAPSELRLPTPNLRPQTGRFAEIRGPFRLTHLGSDYVNPQEDLLVPPHDSAVLVGLVHLKRNTYQAIALDMSGDIQMYMIAVMVNGAPRHYIFCYAHLRDGSNADALQQALSAEGHVEVMGKVSIVGGGDVNLSDIHIGVIDVEALYDFTDTREISTALRRLFSRQLPRTNQQYPDIFVEPESVFPALADALARYRE